MLTNKTVLLTGANGTIGKKILKFLIKSNAEVICHTRKKDKNFINYISKLTKKKLKIFNCDINDEKSFKKEINIIFSKKKKLDVLINNAAEPSGSIIEMTSIKTLKKIFDTNFFSQIRVTQIILKYLKNSKNGSIINIGSIQNNIPMKGTISYGTSKAALMHATKIMANEFAAYNIRANGICPNVVKSKMGNKMDINSMNFLINSSHLKRACDAKDIANLILFLSSNESSYINGQIINLDGGI